MRIPRALALFMLALLPLPSVVAAQTTPAQGGIGIVLQSVSLNGTPIRDTTDDDILLRGYSAAECATRATVTSVFRLTNVPSGMTFVDAWIGDVGQDCATTTARQTGPDRLCVHLGVNADITLNAEITLTLTQMLDPMANACEVTTAAGKAQLLWLFAANSSETTGEVTMAQYGYVAFTVDPNAPTIPVPTSTSVTGGERIPISWNVGSEQNLRYNVYLDTSVGSCDDVGMWVPGGAPSGTPTSPELASPSVSLSTSQLAVGQSALVFVTALDRADNESNLSAAVCITRVETVGFCEALADGGEPCTNTCVATLPGTRQASGGLWLGLAFLALVVRRRAR